MPGYLKILLASLLGVLFIFSTTQAQRIVNVPQGVGTLNEAIDSDTTETGERVDLNTIYVLEDGGFYITVRSIENTFPLYIKAADGYTTRPVVQPGVPPEGGESSRPFTPEGDLHLEGLYVTNLDNAQGLLDRIIRVKADTVTIIVDDCHLDKAGQSAIRLDTEGVTVFIVNSIVSNIGITESMSNGRVIDDRSNDIERVFIQNCTIYNITSRIQRDGGGWIKDFTFNHNTVRDVGQRGLVIGEAVNVTITNNILGNLCFTGRSLTDTTRAFIQIDPIENETLIGEGYVQNITIANNNMYYDTEILDAINAFDYREPCPFADSLSTFWIESKGTGASNITEILSFTNTVEPPADLATAVIDTTDPPLPNWEDGDGGILNQLPFDFTYDGGSQSASAASDGGRLGDLNWYGVVLSNEDKQSVPVEYNLFSNYPNPFNPSTNIKYALPESGIVTLKVYNLLGQEVKTLVNKEQSAGTHSIIWDGTTNFGIKVTSGVYIYSISSKNFVATKKMMLIK